MNKKEFLTLVLERLNFSYHSIAKLLGKSSQYVSDCIDGHTNLTKKDIFTLAKAIDIDPAIPYTCIQAERVSGEEEKKIWLQVAKNLRQ